MLRYAYERKLLVQPLINFGVEHVLDEYTFLKDPYRKHIIEFQCGDVIYPEKYKSLQEFTEVWESRFYRLFDDTHKNCSIENQRYTSLTEEEKQIFYGKRLQFLNTDLESPDDKRSENMVKHILEKKNR